MQRDISIFQIPVSHIEPHPQNPRKDLGDLTELCDRRKRTFTKGRANCSMYSKMRRTKNETA